MHTLQQTYIICLGSVEISSCTYALVEFYSLPTKLKVKSWVIIWQMICVNSFREPLFYFLARIYKLKCDWGMLSCFKDYKRCIHISYHILDFVQQKKTRFTMEQPHLFLMLYCQYHSRWCPGDLRRQGINRNGIDQISRSILSLVSEVLIIDGTLAAHFILDCDWSFDPHNYVSHRHLKYYENNVCIAVANCLFFTNKSVILVLILRIVKQEAE